MVTISFFPGVIVLVLTEYMIRLFYMVKAIHLESKIEKYLNRTLNAPHLLRFEILLNTLKSIREYI